MTNETENTEIKFFGLTYKDGDKDHTINIHAPSEEIAREHAEMNEYVASLTFVSSKVLPPLVHNITS
jgi:hypothetical protein